MAQSHFSFDVLIPRKYFHKTVKNDICIVNLSIQLENLKDLEGLSFQSIIQISYE